MHLTHRKKVQLLTYKINCKFVSEPLIETVGILCVNRNHSILQTVDPAILIGLN